MKSKLFYISFVLNILTFFLVFRGIVVMLTVGTEVLGDNSLVVFKYFTFQSNLFMGIVALIFAIFQFLIIKRRIEKIPHVLNVFLHVGVTAVALTFIIVILFLAPGYGFDLMYQQANLFFHALVPIVAMINYMFFMKDAKIRFIQTLFAIVPCFLYGIVYFAVVVSNNAYGNIDIDFYMFGKDGPLIGAFNFLLVMIIAYIFGLFLYFINYLIFKKRK